MKLNKSIIITVILILLSGGISVFVYDQVMSWVGTERVKAYNSGVVRTTNQYYESAKDGELIIRNFILDEEGKVILEDGRIKQGEEIILIPK